jgi:hypothetical protein
LDAESVNTSSTVSGAPRSSRTRMRVEWFSHEQSFDGAVMSFVEYPYAFTK